MKEVQVQENDSDKSPPVKVDTSSLDRDFTAPLPGDPDFIGPLQQQ
jgi:hypothetical protein